MSEIHGTYRDGHVDLDTPVTWENGIRVAVSPAASGATLLAPQPDDWGIDTDWPDTPESRAEIIRRIDAVEPLDLTPEEEAEWQAMLKWFDAHSLQTVSRGMGLRP